MSSGGEAAAAGWTPNDWCADDVNAGRLVSDVPSIWANKGFSVAEPQQPRAASIKVTESNRPLCSAAITAQPRQHLV